jgi:hypothetical protein
MMCIAAATTLLGLGGGVGRWSPAEAAALLATALAAVAAIPQLQRVIVHSDGRGVSLTSATIGIGTELAWVGYTVSGGLWSALPEAVLMCAANLALAGALVHRGASGGRAVPASVVWIVLLAAVALATGRAGLGVMLAGAYAIQVAPAVWTAWTTECPTGVAAWTWAMVGAEGALWGVYGLGHGDRAVTWFAGVAMATAAAMLLRKVAVRARSALPQSSPQLPQRAVAGERVIEGVGVVAAGDQAPLAA